MKEEIKFYAPFVLMLLMIVGWVILFNYVSPTTLVEKIGIKNSYLVLFALAVICGFSSLTTGTFYVAVAALSAGGSNPLILGLVGGFGLSISDSAFYYFASRGSHVVDKHWKSVSDFLKTWIEKVPDWAIRAGVFVYSSIVPIPNDVLVVALVLGSVRFRKFAPYLFAGDILFTLILAYSSN